MLDPHWMFTPSLVTCSRSLPPLISLTSLLSFLPNPLLSLFPLLLHGGGCWAYATVPLPFSFSNLPLSSMTAINQPLTPWRRAPSGSVCQAQCEYAGALRALPANRAALTSPTPRQRLGSSRPRPSRTPTALLLLNPTTQPSLVRGEEVDPGLTDAPVSQSERAFLLKV
ncbi:hypothetical protein INR49_002342 [Caranx melampygus]|nr:hypothetical protein INR49_002342 [Caranx melampygus]